MPTVNDSLPVGGALTWLSEAGSPAASDGQAGRCALSVCRVRGLLRGLSWSVHLPSPPPPPVSVLARTPSSVPDTHLDRLLEGGRGAQALGQGRTGGRGPGQAEPGTCPSPGAPGSGSS